MSPHPLEDLLERLSNGDAEAAEQVFRAYEPYLRKVVRRQLPGQLRAKFDSIDVVQSVWVDVLQGFREAGWRFPDVDHLRAFLVKVTRNRFIDRVRKHHKALEHEQPLEKTDPAGLLDRQDRPSALAQADELWQRMLDLCVPEHRPVLELKRQGLSAPDIASRLGLHEDSVRRILRNLARHLAVDPAARNGS